MTAGWRGCAICARCGQSRSLGHAPCLACETITDGLAMTALHAIPRDCGQRLLRDEPGHGRACASQALSLPGMIRALAAAWPYLRS